MFWVWDSYSRAFAAGTLWSENSFKCNYAMSDVILDNQYGESQPLFTASTLAFAFFVYKSYLPRWKDQFQWKKDKKGDMPPHLLANMKHILPYRGPELASLKDHNWTDEAVQEIAQIEQSFEQYFDHPENMKKVRAVEKEFLKRYNDMKEIVDGTQMAMNMRKGKVYDLSGLPK